MNKQRWEEICKEEGYSQHTIDSLWGDKPAYIKVEEMSEEIARATCKMMKELHPSWATRENDEDWEREE